jgi:hypothetical protein
MTNEMFCSAYSRDGTGEQSSSHHPHHLNVWPDWRNHISTWLSRLTKSREPSRTIGIGSWGWEIAAMRSFAAQ